MASRRLVVLGTLASHPFAGMAWMHMQIVEGLRRLGHQVYYFETTSSWPYDPRRGVKVCDSEYAVPYLARVAESFGLSAHWAYRRSYSDREWYGLPEREAVALLADADAVFNVAGATQLAVDGLQVPHLVYFGTDPVFHELAYVRGDPKTIEIVEEHDQSVTYGENIGTSASPIPPLPGLCARTRQPVLLDMWESGPPARGTFTTVANWKQEGLDIDFAGETYRWSKHHEFLRFLDLPEKTDQSIELALNLADPESIRHGRGEVVRARGMEPEAQETLRTRGWRLVNAPDFSLNPWTYRNYIQASRGEFTVARDLNVRLRSGWFSERSACYLAAGRPVVTQDTGFGHILPTGEGLFSFHTIEEVLSAFETINSDYDRHSRAAREIAEEYFRAETVLTKLLSDLGL